MHIVIAPNGSGQCVYGDDIDLTSLGSLSIRRASHVEPLTSGMWTADLSPVDGPVLGPFPQRQDALCAEIAWLEQHWLPRGT